MVLLSTIALVGLMSGANTRRVEVKEHSFRDNVTNSSESASIPSGNCAGTIKMKSWADTIEFFRSNASMREMTNWYARTMAVFPPVADMNLGAPGRLNAFAIDRSGIDKVCAMADGILKKNAAGNGTQLFDMLGLPPLQLGFISEKVTKAALTLDAEAIEAIKHRHGQHFQQSSHDDMAWIRQHDNGENILHELAAAGQNVQPPNFNKYPASIIAVREGQCNPYYFTFFFPLPSYVRPYQPGSDDDEQAEWLPHLLRQKLAALGVGTEEVFAILENKYLFTKQNDGRGNMEAPRTWKRLADRMRDFNLMNTQCEEFFSFTEGCCTVEDYEIDPQDCGYTPWFEKVPYDPKYTGPVLTDVTSKASETMCLGEFLWDFLPRATLLDPVKSGKPSFHEWLASGVSERPYIGDGQGGICKPQGHAWELRAYLMSVGYNPMWAGDGKTRDSKGAIGFEEYLIPNKPLGELQMGDFNNGGRVPGFGAPLSGKGGLFSPECEC